MLLECSDPEESILFRPARAVKMLKKWMGEGRMLK